MKKYIEEFLNYLKEVRDCSSLTIKLYDRFLNQLFLENNIEKISDINFKKVEAIRNKLTEKKLDPMSKNLYLVVLRSFLKFLFIRKRIKCFPFDEVELFPKPKNKNHFNLPSPESLVLFLNHKNNPREDFIVNMLFDSGLRIAELHSLNNITPSPHFLIVGKGNKQRQVFITEKTLALWHDYLITRISPDPALLVNLDGQRLTIRSLQKFVVARSKSLSLPVLITPHVLRHLFATTMLEKGTQIHDVKRMLGHSSIVTTERYLHVSDNHLEESYRRAKNFI